MSSCEMICVGEPLPGAMDSHSLLCFCSEAVIPHQQEATTARRVPDVFLGFAFAQAGCDCLSVAAEVRGEGMLLKTVAAFHTVSNSLTVPSSEPSEPRDVLRRCALSAGADTWLNTDTPWSMAELQEPRVLFLTLISTSSRCHGYNKRRGGAPPWLPPCFSRL